MIRFFELNRCLNHNLARYFGDKNAPEHCGHCSVCRGKVLVFPEPIAQKESLEKQRQQMAHYVTEFAQQLRNKSPGTTLTPVLVTRFLTGLAQPIFTKVKARQLTGFGVYEEKAYKDVIAAVKALLTQ